MFEQLFGSKTRVKLLNLFYNNPDRPFYVREITRKVEEQINSVRRELQNLLNIGIVKSVGHGNRLYYELSDKYEFYQEFSSIFTRAKYSSKVIKEVNQIEDPLLKVISTAGTVHILILCGVFVKNSTQSVDMLIVGHLNKTKLAHCISEIEKDMDRELRYSVMTPEDFQYRYDLSERFITDILALKHLVLKDSTGLLQPLSEPSSDATISLGTSDNIKDQSGEKDGEPTI